MKKMLEDYLNNQIEKYTKEKELLLGKMKELVDEETRQNQEIEKLMDQEDVGIELFSPRNPDSKVKVQVENIRKHIDELQYKQAELSSDLDTSQNMINKWQKLLDEAKEKNELANTEELNSPSIHSESFKKDHTEKDPGKIEQKTEQRTEEKTQKKADGEGKSEENSSDFTVEYGHELKEIQRRVNYCLAIIGKDRNKCKGELKSLQYYINALLADSQRK